MNWGVKIFILYTAFVLLTLSMVFFTMNQEIFLVEKDYYKQEIAYQEQIDKMHNAKALSIPLIILFDSTASSLTLSYPPQQLQDGINGTIHFFRPSDAGLDCTYAISPDSAGRQSFSLLEFAKGRWHVKVHWESAGTSYFDQETIDIL